jgi:hypothetical protein
MTASTTPRRRVLRPRRTPAENAARARKVATRRARLEKEQAGLSRWMTKLKRAFHAVEKHQKTVSRLEREIACLEQD